MLLMLSQKSRLQLSLGGVDHVLGDSQLKTQPPQGTGNKDKVEPETSLNYRHKLFTGLVLYYLTSLSKTCKLCSIILYLLN